MKQFITYFSFSVLLVIFTTQAFGQSCAAPSLNEADYDCADLPASADGTDVPASTTHTHSGTSTYSNKMTVNGTGILVVCGSLTLNNGLEIKPGGYVIVKPGATLNVATTMVWDGALYNYGTLNFTGGLNVTINNASGELNNANSGSISSFSGNLTINIPIVNDGTMTIDGNFHSNASGRVCLGLGSNMIIGGTWGNDFEPSFTSPEGPSCVDYAGSTDITFDAAKEPTSGADLNICMSSGQTLTNYGTGTYNAVCSGCSSVLPIGLEYFTIEHPQNIQNLITFNWATESETDNDYFTLQASYNGYKFEDIETVQGAGNSSQTIEYSRTITFSNNPPLYFRLQQTDYNNEVSYSSIIVDKDAFETNLFNITQIAPASINVELELQSPSPVSIKLISAHGQTVSTANFAFLESGLHSIPISGINPGLYVVQIKLANQILMQKVLVD